MQRRLAVTWLGAVCVASTLVLTACGGKLVGEGGGEVDAGDDDSGAIDDGGSSDGGFTDGGRPDGVTPDAAPWDGSDPPPDVGPGGCGVGACMPGTGCYDGCNSCNCISPNVWECTTRYCEDAGPPPPPCPSSLPGDYSYCPIGGQYCSYTTACGGQAAAQCVMDPGGKQYWMTKSEPCATGCPATRPVAGKVCTSPAKCNYPNACGGTDFFYCEGSMSTWKMEPGPCTTPVCPPSTPPPGSSCVGPNKCQWPNACGGYDYGACNSTNSTWFIQSECAPMPVCPPNIPSNGSFCPATQVCYYPNACGTTDKAYCPGPGSSSGWQVSKQTCAACPTTQPTQGSACTQTMNNCAWNNGCGGISYGYCDPAAGWQVKPTGCNMSCPGSKPVSGASCSAPSGTQCQYVVTGGSSCTSSCFCADDGRWACITPPCASTPP